MEFLNSNTSQIEGLHHIYNEIFPNITDGFFVEVGAYDGYRWSNTLSLINNGWGGAFIEPIPRYADSCRKRYENNKKIKTYECCIGWENIKDKKVYLGGPCTTTLESMVELYSKTDPGDNHNLNKYITAPMYTLDTFLEENEIKENFEVLVIDVEGAEWDILEKFSINKWKPQMAIIETWETCTIPKKYEYAQETFPKINKLFTDNGYKHIYGDEVNSIWVLK